MREIPVAPIGYRLVYELDGLIRGIAADEQIVPAEIDRLRRWRAEATPYVRIEPFADVVAQVDRALSDGLLTLDECQDLLFVTSNLTTVNPHYDAMRAGLQTLHAIVSGLVADRLIPDSEVRALSAWLDDWSHLKGLWPFDECESIVSSLLVSPSPEGVQYLIALADQVPVPGHVTDQGEVPFLVGAVCAINPDVAMAGKQFVFTGESKKASRDQMERLVQDRQGSASRKLTSKTDFLVACDGGSPYWAFACYGRKIERAMEMRRQGHTLAIIHEVDFWDSLN